jgi:hypothetical protein
LIYKRKILIGHMKFLHTFRDRAPSIIILVLTSLLFVSGCAVQKEIRPDVEKTPEKMAPAPTPVKPEVIVLPDVTKVPDVAIAPDVAIVLSAKATAYSEIANQLKVDLKEKAEIFTLSGKEHIDTQIIRAIQSSGRQQVVAIGLRAARATSILKGKQIIFAQVFNYRDHHLVTDSMKGVSTLPPPEKLFNDWKQLSPKLSQVVVVSGKSLAGYINRAKIAASKYNIDLLHRVVNNDKEFIYTVKHLPGVIQGHWLLPDNRVLSRKALKEIMSYNSKQGRQTVVFRPKLLSYGGLFYVTPSSTEISRLVLKRLENSIGKEKIPGKDILPLTDYNIGINPRIASQHGLKIPDSLKEFIYE